MKFEQKKKILNLKTLEGLILFVTVGGWGVGLYRKLN